MSSVAYCANCRANFSDPREVASIVGGAKGMCVGCSSVVEVPHENASSFQPVAVANVDALVESDDVAVDADVDDRDDKPEVAQ